MRLIDADAVIEEMSEKHRPNFHEDLKAYHMWIMWYWALKEAPTIDAVEVVRGEWICHEGKWIDFDYYPTKYECNQCHHYVDVASDKKFCPNCGARMKGADDE